MFNIKGLKHVALSLFVAQHDEMWSQIDAPTTSQSDYLKMCNVGEITIRT
jgi:hypothetical protein